MPGFVPTGSFQTGCPSDELPRGAATKLLGANDEDAATTDGRSERLDRDHWRCISRLLRKARSRWPTGECRPYGRPWPGVDRTRETHANQATCAPSRRLPGKTLSLVRRAH